MSEPTQNSDLLTEPVRLQVCVTCDVAFASTRLRCPVSQDHALMWAESSGRGTIYSWTITNVALTEAARGLTPYVTVLVELEEGVRLMAHLPGNAEPVDFGVGVRVAKVSAGQGTFLPDALMAYLTSTETEEPR